jgi:CDP-diacylglycerol---glycerol-3-phosphate 3-phosphatidyltransferase
MKILIPTALSSVRIAVVPLFFYFYNQSIALCLILFAFAVATDLLDGYAARKLKAISRFGAYYDASTDFILVIGIYSFFTTKGFYPVWLPILIVISFTTFFITSLIAKKIHDPVGRYTGSALYIGIILTLLLPTQAIFSFVQYAYALFFLISLTSRIISLTKKRKQKNLS